MAPAASAAPERAVRAGTGGVVVVTRQLDATTTVHVHVVMLDKPFVDPE
jgi:hypothetical protein